MEPGWLKTALEDRGFTAPLDDGTWLTQKWIGLEDGTPIFVIRTTCSCGRFETERRYDLSSPEWRGPLSTVEDGEVDSLAYLAHVLRDHDAV